MGVFRQFPYSNFHEMNMDEIIKIVKNMLEEWAQYYAEWDAWMTEINDDWSNYQEVMNEAWQNMQDFINTYFDNLDVQNEINNKITSMVDSGEFATIVEPYIPPRVTAWLAEHITEPVGVVIDTSLTVSGACADSKATGDAIGIVLDELSMVERYNSYNLATMGHLADGDSNGIDYTYNSDDDTITADGTASSSYNSYYYLFNSPTSLGRFETGVKYKYDVEMSGPYVNVQLYYYVSGGATTYITPTNGYFEIPSNAIGFALRLYVGMNKTVTNVKVSLSIRKERTNEELGDEIDNINKQLNNYNSFDMTKLMYVPKTASLNGIAFSFDGNTVTANGTASANTYFYWLNSPTSLNIFEVGKTYYIDYSATSGLMPLQIILKDSGGSDIAVYGYEESFSIPNNAVGILIRLKIGNGVTVTNESATLAIRNAKTNNELAEEIDKSNPHISADLTTLVDTVYQNIDDNSIVFVQTTDSHVGASAMPLDRSAEHFEKAISIARGVNADFIIHTGDMIQGDGSTQGTDDRERYQSYIATKSFYPTPFLWCQGNCNHDFGETSEGAYSLNRGIVNTLVGRFGQYFTPHFNANDPDDLKSYYYFDIDKQNTRIIVLDADDYNTSREEFGFSTYQIAWLTSVLSDSSDKKVIIFSHMAPKTSLLGMTDIDSRGGTGIASACESFVSGGGTIIEFVYGHIHADLLKKVNGINYVALTCDLPVQYTGTLPSDAVAPARTIGTITEFAYDVHIVNTDTNAVKIFRYGAGNDRTINGLI